MVEDVLSRYSPPKPGCLSDVHAVDGEARVHAREMMELA
jgi:hypothetical protein